MAIDNNTSYELKGSQIKDIANKIKAKADDNIFIGATSAIPGSKGLVPEPQAGDDEKFLSGDGTWQYVSGGTPKIVEYTITDNLSHYSWGQAWINQNPNLNNLNWGGSSGNAVIVDPEKKTLVSPEELYDHYYQGHIVRFNQEFRSTNYSGLPAGDLLSYYCMTNASSSVDPRKVSGGTISFMFFDQNGIPSNFPFRMVSFRGYLYVSYNGQRSYIYEFYGN